jgi:hypothetical protein
MTLKDPDARARLLHEYDTQLRNESETPSAVSVTLLGPLRLVTFAGGRGFVTYRDLGNLDEDQLRQLVPRALESFQHDLTIDRVEWKTRAHDAAPGLEQALLDNDFVADEPESIMIGEAASLATDVPLPEGITLRTVVSETDVRAMSAMQDDVFVLTPTENGATSAN